MQLADKMWTIKLHYKQKGFFPSQESIPPHTIVMIDMQAFISWDALFCLDYHCEHFY